MAKQKHSEGSKPGHRENVITAGGIETAVEGFFGDITHSSPASGTYGAHKKHGTDMAPVVSGGRKGAKQVLRKKMY